MTFMSSGMGENSIKTTYSLHTVVLNSIVFHPTNFETRAVSKKPIGCEIFHLTDICTYGHTHHKNIWSHGYDLHLQSSTQSRLFSCIYTKFNVSQLMEQANEACDVYTQYSNVLKLDLSMAH